MDIFQVLAIGVEQLVFFPGKRLQKRINLIEHFSMVAPYTPNWNQTFRVGMRFCFPNS